MVAYIVTKISITKSNKQIDDKEYSMHTKNFEKDYITHLHLLKQFVT